MGLAANQIRLLSLTQRKADVEYGLSIDSMRKMALTREQTELSQEYYSRLQSKNLAYYENGDYHKLNMKYFLGTDVANRIYDGSYSGIKSDNSMVLTDFKGRVVVDDAYETIFEQMGYSEGKCPDIANLADFLSRVSKVDIEKIKSVLEDNSAGIKYSADIRNARSDVSTDRKFNGTYDVGAKIQRIIDFYAPIYRAACINGWTSEYATQMNSNENYVNDALQSGTFQLVQVDDYGGYNPDSSLTYFINTSQIISRNDSTTRNEVTAWYEAEKSRIAEKEDYLDIEINELSTELEAVKTEIESINSFIKDAINAMGSGGTTA